MQAVQRTLCEFSFACITLLLVTYMRFLLAREVQQVLPRPVPFHALHTVVDDACILPFTLLSLGKKCIQWVNVRVCVDLFHIVKRLTAKTINPCALLIAPVVKTGGCNAQMHFLSVHSLRNQLKRTTVQVIRFEDKRSIVPIAPFAAHEQVTDTDVHSWQSAVATVWTCLVAVVAVVQPRYDCISKLTTFTQAYFLFDSFQ